jgi:hypothetical protein
MLIKEDFILLKGVNNTLGLSKKQLKSFEINKGTKKLFLVLKMMENKLNHFTKDYTLNLLSDIKRREVIKVISYKNYILSSSYNNPTRNLIFNLSPFNIDDVYPDNPSPFTTYSNLVYGITFGKLIQKQLNIDESQFNIFADYINSIILRVFGKSYGLLGRIGSGNINKLKFIVGIYVLQSFFGTSINKSLMMSANYAKYDYRNEEELIKKYDLTNIDQFIQLLSDIKLMSGLNKHMFTAKIMRMFTFNMIPALEDISRFISVITASNIKGSSLVPTFLYKYNEKAYYQILEISKQLFK